MPIARITALGITPVKYSGVTKLNRVVINQKGASSNLLTLRDGAADGTIVAIIDTTSVVGDINYNFVCRTGLTAVSATGSAGDITIVFDENI